MDVVGYADRLSVEAGTSLNFMVSSQRPSYDAAIVRLFHGDVNPNGPGFKAEPVASSIEGTYPGRVQEIRTGSCISVPLERNVVDGSFTIQMWIRSTTPHKSRQVLISIEERDRPGVSLELNDGRVSLCQHGSGSSIGTVTLATLVRGHMWYFLAATYDTESEEATLSLWPCEPTASELGGTVRKAVSTGRSVDVEGSAQHQIVIGARSVKPEDVLFGDFYNGKIDTPKLYGRALSEKELVGLRNGASGAAFEGLMAEWDFSVGISSSRAADVSGNGLDGTTVQRPTRAVTGHNWDGTEASWAHIPQQYGAVHFHDDDLDDAGWEPSLNWQVPEDLRSGVYALRLQAGQENDYVPFAVRPGRGQPKAKALFVMPTFSYLAYANAHLPTSMRELMTEMGADLDSSSYPSAEEDIYIIENRLNSLYDVHSDGSGVCYSSRMRPLVSMRPKYNDALLDDGRGSPHQFSADLHLVDWLHQHNYDCDVVTDEDLYHEGSELLMQYRVVLTGTHHEYWASRMLDAVREYLDSGGRLMYMGGNGFYWVTELDPDLSHTVEIRRAAPSTRTWEAAPGEAYLASTGELGGIWRYRNRAPQRLVGVGFTAQGVGAGRPYARHSFDPVTSFVFEGVETGEMIGDYPSLVSSFGAAGYEMDRMDHSLGSPYRTVVLATATGFSDAFQHVSEEVKLSTGLEGGTVNKLVRADMTLLEYPNGGAVFSTGSVTWCASLSYNEYQNNVSRITANVLDRFLEGLPVFRATRGPREDVGIGTPQSGGRVSTT